MCYGHVQCVCVCVGEGGGAFNIMYVGMILVTYVAFCVHVDIDLEGQVSA